MKKNIFLGALLLASPLVLAKRVNIESLVAKCKVKNHSRCAELENLLREIFEENNNNSEVNQTEDDKAITADAEVKDQAEEAVDNVVDKTESEEATEVNSNVEEQQVEPSDEGMAAATESENDSVAPVEPSEDGMTEEATLTKTEDAQ